MSRSIAVVDYGMGNLRSVSQAVAHVAREVSKSGTDFTVQVTADPDVVRASERVVLPGQGAMRDCMQELAGSHGPQHPEGALKAAVLEAAATKPLMGVCVGMQMLLDHSEEQDTPGLGLIPGQVKRFQLAGRIQPDGSRYKVPQMGWNRVQQTSVNGSRHAMWNGIPDDAWFYFVHSYFAQPRDEAHIAGMTDYGGAFTCVVARDNIFATQFHPEKSAAHGLSLYRNFLLWQP